MTVIKVVGNQIFKKSVPSLETNLTLLFFTFSFARPTTKAQPPNSQQ